MYWCYVELNRETRVQDYRIVMATGEQIHGDKIYDTD